MYKNLVSAGLRPGSKSLLLIFGSIVLIAGWLLGPLPQDPHYHDFVDKRAWSMLPHAADVLSNLPFCLFGALGLWTVLQRRDRLGNTGNLYLAFFAGVFLTGFGSAWYHFAPDNTTLVWDRLPMAIGFIGIFCAILAERIDAALANRLFPWLLAAGIGSVLYWHLVDDLRPYVVVQFGTLIALAWMLLRERRDDSRLLWLALGFYLLAKLFEAGDEVLFLLSLETVSGHTLKHLAASIPALLILWKLRGQVDDAGLTTEVRVAAARSCPRQAPG